MPGQPLYRQLLVQMPSTPVVFGWVFASHQIGAAIAAAGAGRLRDLQGNYDLAFYVAAGLCLVAAVLCANVRKAQVSTPAVLVLPSGDFGIGR